ncbi:MAG TPA: hypothetical protein VLB29_04555 [Nocardioidaceae bacterium]|nr:hypothetical protein [Nocardioidaceae bacterium]
MSADHRKPFMAFVVLAVLATALVGVHRANAEPGRFFAAAIGARVSVEGTLPIRADSWEPAVVVTGQARAVTVPAVGAVGLSPVDETARLDEAGSREGLGADSDSRSSARAASAEGTRFGAREVGKAIERAAEVAPRVAATSRSGARRRVGLAGQHRLFGRPHTSTRANSEKRSRASGRHAAQNPQLGS